MHKSPARLSWSVSPIRLYSSYILQRRGKKIPIIVGQKISTVNSLDFLIAHRSTRHIGFLVVFSSFKTTCFLSLSFCILYLFLFLYLSHFLFTFLHRIIFLKKNSNVIVVFLCDYSYIRCLKKKGKIFLFYFKF